MKPKPFFRTREISIRTIVSLSIAVTMVFLISIVLLFSYQGNKYSTFKLTESLMNQVFFTTSHRLDSFFSSSLQSILNVKYSIEKSRSVNFSPDDQHILRRTVLITPFIVSAYIGDSRGNYFMAKKLDRKYISFRKIVRSRNSAKQLWFHQNPKFNAQFPPYQIQSLKNAYDPRVRPWYIKAKKEKKIIWTDPYVFASDNQLGISIASPIKTSEVDGVVTLDFGLKDVNDFIASLEISKIATVFLLKNEKVIAYSSPNIKNKTFFKTIQKKDGRQSFELLSTEDVSSPLIDISYKNYLNQKDKQDSSLYKNKIFTSMLNFYLMFLKKADWLDPITYQIGQNSQKDLSLTDSDKKNNKTFFSSFNYQEEKYLFMFKNINIANSTLAEKIGIIIPQSAILSTFNYIFYLTLFLSALFLILSLIIIILILNKSISHPIILFAKIMTKMVSDFQLNQSSSPVRSGIKVKEISLLNSSFENIRGAMLSFKKYLPQEVVAGMIKSGQEAVVGGIRQEITILFSDIQDFTTITEENSPDVLIQKLKIYFHSINKVIATNHGILDKYIGDAVMAMWGVPNALPNHAGHACVAAIEMVHTLQKINRQFEAEDFPKFITRIGINTGVVLVGNIGSDDRLNYTCMGDGVNLASRLEALNKFYKTQVLVSNVTYQQARDYVEARLVDRVNVKGKTQKVMIREIIGKKGELKGDEKSFLESYREGIRFYFDGQWQEATDHLEKARELKPKDFITQSYLTRATKYSNDPPPDNQNDSIFLDR